MMTVENAITLASALSDLTRFRLLLLLNDSPASVGELAGLLQVKSATVSHHIVKLQDVGLVEVRARGRRHIVHLRHARWMSLLSGFHASWQNP